MSLPTVPAGYGQVEDLHRTRVTVRYLRDGRECRRRVRAVDLDAWCRERPLLPGMPDNPMRRAVGARPRAKVFARVASNSE